MNEIVFTCLYINFDTAVTALDKLWMSNYKHAFTSMFKVTWKGLPLFCVEKDFLMNAISLKNPSQIKCDFFISDYTETLVAASRQR